MTKTDILELAKQGSPKAIAALIDRSLQPKGITAKVALIEGCLHVLLEADKVPNQKVLANFIYQGTLELRAESIQSVKVYGRSLGNSSPAWSEKFDLDDPTSLPAQTSNPFLYTGREKTFLSSGAKSSGAKSSGAKRTKVDLKRNGLERGGATRKRLNSPKGSNPGEPLATEPPKQTAKQTADASSESPPKPEVLTAQDCEDLLHEVGHFPSQGKLSVAYYYAIPKLAGVLVNFLPSSGSMVDAIATRYRGELACLLLTEKYLACFSLPEFSKDPKRAFVFKLKNIDKIAIAKNGIIVYRKKHPGLSLYFYDSKSRDLLKNAIGNKVAIQQRRLIPPDRYEVGFAILGFVTLILCIWVNLLALWAPLLFLLNTSLGPLD